MSSAQGSSARLVMENSSEGATLRIPSRPLAGDRDVGPRRSTLRAGTSRAAWIILAIMDRLLPHLDADLSTSSSPVLRCAQHVVQHLSLVHVPHYVASSRS